MTPSERLAAALTALNRLESAMVTASTPAYDDTEEQS